MASKVSNKPMFTLMSIADAATWYCALVLLALILFTSLRGASPTSDDDHHHDDVVKRNQILDRSCDEIYVVKEGETLHTISDKCGDPFIVEENPHIHDPDDVFPGLVIKITPSRFTYTSIVQKMKDFFVHLLLIWRNDLKLALTKLPSSTWGCCC